MSDVPLVPEVSDEEVLGSRRSAGRWRGVSRWVAWLLIALLLLSIVWGLFVITP